MKERRGASPSRERMIQASIELLDSGGEDGLTLRALSQLLSTGPGAIYGHIANKSDLLTAFEIGIEEQNSLTCL